MKGNESVQSDISSNSKFKIQDVFLFKHESISNESKYFLEHNLPETILSILKRYKIPFL